MSRSYAASRVAGGRPKSFILVIANCAPPTAAGESEPGDRLQSLARSALATGHRPVLLVLPARGSSDLRGLDQLDLWLLTDDGAGDVDAALRAAGEAFDELPQLADCGLLVLASSPPDCLDRAHELLARAWKDPLGVACDGRAWPLAARREILAEMATVGFEDCLRGRAISAPTETAENSDNEVETRAWDVVGP